MTLAVELQYRTRRPWAPAPATLRRWARLAAGRQRGELGIRVVGSRESRVLNGRWRGRDRPTNVLSFQGEAPQLGDIVVCAPVIAREAREQGKPLPAHWAHVIVHGTLHLLGFDHAREADAKRMERRERALLARLGYADPYGG
ncbi:MAG: rRNA maturation RNase YbeY [Gammaproteobacteria bacterium]